MDHRPYKMCHHKSKASYAPSARSWERCGYPTPLAIRPEIARKPPGLSAIQICAQSLCTRHGYAIAEALHIDRAIYRITVRLRLVHLHAADNASLNEPLILRD